MDSILDALTGIALLVIPALGYLIWQYVKLQQVRIANQILQEEKRAKEQESEALKRTLAETASIAVKSTSQTVVSGHRDADGTLPPVVADTAKETARQTLKKLLSPEQLRAVRAQYGMGEGAVNEVLDPLIEAALHDMKTKSATTEPTQPKDTP